MPVWLILLLKFLIPEIIKIIVDIISGLGEEKDPAKKAEAQAELDAIKFEVMRKKRVGFRERERLEALRDRLKAK